MLSSPANALVAPQTHCGLTELFKFTDINSPREQCDAQAPRQLNFSQPGYSQMNLSQCCASQELGTQDFCTPRDGYVPPVQAFNQSQRPALAAVAPPSLQPIKRTRDVFEEAGGTTGLETPQTWNRMNLDAENANQLRSPELEAAPAGPAIVKGMKKMKALAGSRVEEAPDLCECSFQEYEEWDVQSYVRHNAVPADSRGSYSHCFREVRELGAGAFGRVVHAADHAGRGNYAVKLTRLGHRLTDQELKRVLLEAQVVRLLSENCDATGVMRYHGSGLEEVFFKNETTLRFFLQVDLCGDSLRAALDKGARFTEQQLVSILNQVATVLETLHWLGFVHMDIKPDNILAALKPRGAPPGRAAPDLVKLGDFGLACKADGSWPLEEGDRRYCSREVLAGARSDLRAGDVFSLGVTLYELASGSVAPDDGPLYEALRAGAAPQIVGYSASFHALVQRMLHPHTANRPTAAELSRWSLSKDALHGPSLLKPFKKPKAPPAPLFHAAGSSDVLESPADSRGADPDGQSTKAKMAGSRNPTAASRDGSKSGAAPHRAGRKLSDEKKKRDGNGRVQSTLNLTRLFS